MERAGSAKTNSETGPAAIQTTLSQDELSEAEVLAVVAEVDRLGEMPVGATSAAAAAPPLSLYEELVRYQEEHNITDVPSLAPSGQELRNTNNSTTDHSRQQQQTEQTRNERSTSQNSISAHSEEDRKPAAVEPRGVYRRPFDRDYFATKTLSERGSSAEVSVPDTATLTASAAAAAAAVSSTASGGVPSPARMGSTSSQEIASLPLHIPRQQARGESLNETAFAAVPESSQSSGANPLLSSVSNPDLQREVATEAVINPTARNQRIINRSRRAARGVDEGDLPVSSVPHHHRSSAIPNSRSQESLQSRNSIAFPQDDDEQMARRLQEEFNQEYAGNSDNASMHNSWPSPTPRGDVIDAETEALLRQLAGLPLEQDEDSSNGNSSGDTAKLDNVTINGTTTTNGTHHQHHQPHEQHEHQHQQHNQQQSRNNARHSPRRRQRYTATDESTQSASSSQHTTATTTSDPQLERQQAILERFQREKEERELEKVLQLSRQESKDIVKSQIVQDWSNLRRNNNNQQRRRMVPHAGDDSSTRSQLRRPRRRQQQQTDKKGQNL